MANIRLALSKTALKDVKVLTDAWLAQLVERRFAVRDVEGSETRPDQHSGS